VIQLSLNQQNLEPGTKRKMKRYQQEINKVDQVKHHLMHLVKNY